MALPFNRVRRGAINHIVLTPEYCVSPSDVGMGELKTCCLLQAVDGGGQGSNGEVNSPRSAAQRSKGEHEMPISCDNPDAHAFWHCVHLEMFTGLPVAFKEMIGMSFLSSITLSFLPAAISSCWSTYMSYPRSFGFFTNFSFTFLLFQGISCLSVAPFVFTASLPLHCSCYVYSHHFLLDIKIIGFFSPLLSSFQNS